jgi:hypothetical protein
VNRRIVEMHLEQAKRHVVVSASDVARQRRMVDDWSVMVMTAG